MSIAMSKAFAAAAATAACIAPFAASVAMIADVASFDVDADVDSSDRARDLLEELYLPPELLTDGELFELEASAWPLPRLEEMR